VVSADADEDRPATASAAAIIVPLKNLRDRTIVSSPCFALARSEVRPSAVAAHPRYGAAA
jgi:hypothetical protein